MRRLFSQMDASWSLAVRRTRAHTPNTAEVYDPATNSWSCRKRGSSGLVRHRWKALRMLVAVLALPISGSPRISSVVRSIE